MDTNIALIASGYLLTRIGIFAAFAYFVYRVLRSKSNAMANPSQANLGQKHAQTRRFER